MEERPTLRIEAAMLDPRRDGVIELDTHVSRVVFTGDLAHKWKKPVHFAFVDQSTVERREELCHLEVELNRRFSPDVYLGVEEIVDGDGRVVDHAVLMRRMPDDRRLATRVRAGDDVAPCLRAVAAIVAAQHEAAASAVTDEVLAVATFASVWDLWERNLVEMASFAPEILDPDALARVGPLARRYLDGRVPLLDDRIASGHIVDGHGDLLADDIFCLDDGPRILDCLEFDEHLRWGDVVLDIGFLAMDLEHLGRPDLARVLLDHYVAVSGHSHPASLEHHYVAYRALVRAKVSCLKGSGHDRTEAGQYLAQCLDHLVAAQPRLIVVGGLPGTGKSTLAAALAEMWRCALIRSDATRKSLVGLDPAEHRPAAYGEGLYSPAMTERTYHAVLDEARQRLALGESVIVDASFTRERWRREAAEAASATRSELVELRCVLPADVAERRLSARAVKGTDPSDADPLVAVSMARDADPWPSAQVVDTLPPLLDLLAGPQVRRVAPHPGWAIRP